MRASNIPIPEAHLAALGLDAAAHWLVPLRLPVTSRRWLVATPLVAGGVAVAAWAVRSAGDVDLERDGELVTRGAFAVSRNPMYVGWAAATLGVAVAARSAPLLAAWVAAVHHVDGEVRAEERRLAARHGGAYASYASRVPRYLPLTPR